MDQQDSPLYPPSASNGIVAQIPGLWSAFVDMILEITTEAYDRMNAERSATRDWAEDTFTLRLTRSIEKVARGYSLNLQVVPQWYVFTEEMETGKASTSEAVRIDIYLCNGGWENKNRVYFAWEAKLIVAEPLDKDQERLRREYITKGIFRYIDAEYSDGLPDAGMLGYVLHGNVVSIVNALNKIMLKSHRIPNAPSHIPPRQLTEYDQLTLASPVGKFEDKYLSHHVRPSTRTVIKLHHLFLSFDFS